MGSPKALDMPYIFVHAAVFENVELSRFLFKGMRYSLQNCYNEVIWMEKEKERIYSSNDVASLLQIQNSTLRKYCLMLSKEGYVFHKNSKGVRGFFDQDIIVLRKVIEIKKNPDMTLERACKAVVTWHNGNGVTTSDTTVTEPQIGDKDIIELYKLIERLQASDNRLLELLERQQKYIELRLDNQHHEVVTAIQEIKDEQHIQIEPPKRKWWQRLLWPD